MSIDTDWLETRITKTQQQIEALEDAIIGLTDGTIQSYTLDTGQSRTVVSRHEIGRLQTVLDTLYVRLNTLCNRANGGGSVNVAPGW